MGNEKLDLLIVGGGPGGLTAGIYATRSGLKALLIDQGACGGMAATSPFIENYPGFERISGMDLTNLMREQTEKLMPIEMGVKLETAEISGRGFILKSGEKEFECSALILATGSKYRNLGVPGEGEFIGKGVSYCATCDGFFFKDKNVLVVGGGNNGATEALHLKHVGAAVTLIHRRDTLRAEETLQKHMREDGVKLILNSTVEAIEGSNTVERVQVKNKETGEVTSLEFDGVFISIGDVPETELAQQLGVRLTDQGYIQVNREQRTNVERVYAAGDVTGGFRQIITACAEGATASSSAYNDLKKPYWTE